MNLCKKCGAHLENEIFCPVCGARTQKVDIKEKIADIKIKAKREENSSIYIGYSDINKNKGFAVISYIWILFLVPIFGAKDSKYARFHANQGLNLFLAELILIVITGLLINIPLLGGLFNVFATLLSMVFLIFHIMGIVNAVKGRVKPLPVIGAIRLIK